LAIPSIKARFAVSTFGNLIRGGLTFFAAIFIARALGPENYGNYAFLLGSFTALRGLLDMGTENAFYTFISQKARPLAFFISFAIWKSIQFLFPFIVIAFFLPQTWLETIWVGQERSLVLLAFTGLFFQQLIWPSISHIGESKRLTQRVQILNISISATNLGIILTAWTYNILTVPFLFWVLLFQYVIALIVALKAFSILKAEKKALDVQAMIQEYLNYCLPLVLYSWLGFAYEFTDRWLLQHFGGSEEQAFFMVNYRFATIGLLVISSMLNIFWKEIAEARENQNIERLHTLYFRVTRFLYILSASVCGFLIPWNKTITSIILGPSYTIAGPLLAVMLIFFLFSGMAQVNNTFLLSSGKTKTHMIQGCIFMAISIPISYLIQASPDALIPGLHLGSMGMAYKSMVLVIIQMNCVCWWIAKDSGWKYDWAYQVTGLAGTLTFGWLSYGLVKELTTFAVLNSYIQMTMALVIYSIMMTSFIWLFPGLTGFSRMEIKSMIFKS